MKTNERQEQRAQEQKHRETMKKELKVHKTEHRPNFILPSREWWWVEVNWGRENSWGNGRNSLRVSRGKEEPWRR